jgi:hypothetical protein
MPETRLFLVILQISDEIGFFNAALGLGRKKPSSIRLHHWYMSADGATSYAIWEAVDAHALMGVLDVEFAKSATYVLTEVNVLHG